MRRPAPAALALLAGAVLWLLWCGAGGLLRRDAWAPESLGTYVYRTDFRDNPQVGLGRSTEAWGWEPTPSGLAVPGGGEAVLRYAFDAEQPVGYARLDVQGRLAGGLDLAIEARDPSGRTIKLFCADGTGATCGRLAGGNLGAIGRRLLSVLTGSLPAGMDLSPLLRTQGAFDVLIRVRNRESAPAPTVQSVVLTLSAPFYAPQAARLLFWVPVPALLLMALPLAIGWLTSRRRSLRLPRRGSPPTPADRLAGSAGVSPAPSGVAGDKPPRYVPLIRTSPPTADRPPGTAGVLARPPALVDEIRLRWTLQGGRLSLSLISHILAFWITAWALLVRLDTLVSMGSGGLEPDARGYLGAARSLGLLGLYSPLEREPLFPYLARLWQELLGPGEVALRMLTIVASTAAVALTYVLGRSLVGTLPALLAAGVMAIHPFFVWNATRALREEVGLALLLALVAVLWRPGHAGVGRGVAAGVFAGALLLLRMDMLPVSLLALGTTAWLRRWPVRVWGPALGLTALLFTPFLWVQWRAHGDPMYPASLQARAFRNYEFHDLPGFPTRADMDRDQFLAGPPISWVGYYFGLHTPADLVITTGAGSVRILQSVAINTLPGTSEAARWVLIAVLVTGAAVAAFQRYRVLALVGTVLLLQFAFLHVKAYRYSQVDAYGGVDPRLFMSGFPFLLLCAAALITLLTRAAFRRPASSDDGLRTQGVKRGGTGATQR